MLQPEDIPEWATGYIYKITRLANSAEDIKQRIYIGKKQLISNTRKKIGVREKAATKTRKKYKTISKGSGWGNYWSSCVELKNDVVYYGESQFRRDILEWCFSKKNATYRELWWQFRYDVLINDTYNSNINGSLYRHDTDRELYAQHLQKMREMPRKPRKKKENIKMLYISNN